MLFSKKNILALTASAAVLGGLSVSANAEQNSDSSQPTGVIGSRNQDGKFFDADGNERSNATNIEGKSDAHVRVTKGYLTLNLVPSFGFGTVNGNNSDKTSSNSATGQTLKNITDNQAILNSDSLHGKNDSKTLSVTDSRTATNTGKAGYTVSAKMGQFKKEENGEQKGSAGNDSINPFVLNLSNGEIQKGNSSVTGKTSFSLSEGDKDAVSEVLKSNDDGSGSSSITFNNGSLYVPNDVGIGNYAASITWTLTPNTSNNAPS